jgi:hypothetical protein
MQSRALKGLILATALALPVAGGCARTISEKETVKHKSDGSTTVDRQTVKEHPDGTISVEKEKEVNR